MSSPTKVPGVVLNNDVKTKGNNTIFFLFQLKHDYHNRFHYNISCQITNRAAPDQTAECYR